MSDGRTLLAVALLGIAGAAAVRGSRGVVRASHKPKQGSIYKVLGVTGDVNPLKYGGGVTFRDLDGIPKWWVWGEADPEDDIYHVHEVALDQDLLARFDWVNLREIGDATNNSVAKLKADAKNKDPVNRAWFVEAIAQVHGLHGVDNEPTEYTGEELVQRFGF